jgi:hypothetical protein
LRVGLIVASRRSPTAYNAISLAWRLTLREQPRDVRQLEPIAPFLLYRDFLAEFLRDDSARAFLFGSRPSGVLMERVRPV